MNHETSHVSQWKELEARAKNFNLNICVCSDAFILIGPPLVPGQVGRDQVGTYPTLFDLRAGISDWVAAQRTAGVRI